MAETNNHGQKTVESFTIRRHGTKQVVRAGDCVLIRPSLHGEDKRFSVARVEKMETCCGCRGVAARVRWYYRPEETQQGRHFFQGAGEVLLSDHFDTRSAHTFEAKCAVHTLKEYKKLSEALLEDFFCRFEYKVASASITGPDKVTVCCTCEVPYNPDLPMIRCSGCKDRFHPSCVHVDIEQTNLDQFLCPNCVQENCSKEHSNPCASSPSTKRKNITSPSIIPGVPRETVPIKKTKDNVSKRGKEHNVATTATPRKVSRLE